MIKTLMATVCLFFVSVAASAEELWMFHKSDCFYCQTFLYQIGPRKYAESEQSNILPLRIVNLEDASTYPDGLTQAYQSGRISGIVGTPTFIVWDEAQEREVARFIGYGGVEWFYERVDLFIRELKLNSGQGE